MKRKLLLSLLAMLLAATGCADAPSGISAGGPPRSSTSATEGSMWGVNINQIYNPTAGPTVMQYARDAGIGWIRMDFNWTDLQPSGPGPLVKDKTEPTSRYAAEKGLSVLGVLAYTPQWATPGQVNNPHLAPDPAGLNAWEEFVRLVVSDPDFQHIKYWEIWNEPNVGGSQPGVGFLQHTSAYTDRVAAYDSLLSRAARAIHAAGDFVVGPALGPPTEEARTFLYRVLNDVGSQIDVVSLHHYGRATDVADAPQIIVSHYPGTWRWDRIWLTEAGPTPCNPADAPHWYCEWGTLTGVGPSGSQYYKIRDDYKAAHLDSLLTSFAQKRAQGGKGEKVFYFHMYEEVQDWGIIRGVDAATNGGQGPGAIQPRQAWHRYRWITSGRPPLEFSVYPNEGTATENPQGTTVYVRNALGVTMNGFRVLLNGQDVTGNFPTPFISSDGTTLSAFGHVQLQSGSNSLELHGCNLAGTCGTSQTFTYTYGSAGPTFSTYPNPGPAQENPLGLSVYANDSGGMSVTGFQVSLTNSQGTQDVTGYFPSPGLTNNNTTLHAFGHVPLAPGSNSFVITACNAAGACRSSDGFVFTL